MHAYGHGDASLWYVVADANGFDAATDTPAAGQTLKLPEVTTNSNTAGTFKPYNPREISGSTTPSLPQAPQPRPSAHHCSTLAEIVVIAVVIVVSNYTAGAAAEAMGVTTTAGESTFAVGATAMSGGYGAVGVAAVGGAAGNAAGQIGWRCGGNSSGLLVGRGGGCRTRRGHHGGLERCDHGRRKHQ